MRRSENQPHVLINVQTNGWPVLRSGRLKSERPRELRRQRIARERRSQFCPSIGVAYADVGFAERFRIASGRTDPFQPDRAQSQSRTARLSLSGFSWSVRRPARLSVPIQLEDPLVEKLSMLAWRHRRVLSCEAGVKRPVEKHAVPIHFVAWLYCPGAGCALDCGFASLALSTGTLSCTF
jgi:hypothetical protein